MNRVTLLTKSFAVLLAVVQVLPGAEADGGKPNIVLILADDMGIDSVSAFNDKLGLETPAIDRLAAEGMSFTDAHSTSGVCSPTRYSVLTGRYSWRSRLKRGIVSKWERPLIADKRRTLPELLREKGYDTAMIGKWHLGWHWPKKGGGTTQTLDQIDFSSPVKGGPNDHGFDHYFGDDVPNWPPYAWRENDRLLGEITTTVKRGTMVGVSAGPAVADWDFRAVLAEYGKRCSAYIRGRADAEKPFFLYFPMPSPHTPIAPHEDFRGRTGISEYADFLVQTDAVVGQVLTALDRSGQTDRTLVIFCCDNGTSPKADFAALDAAGIHLNEHWRGWKADAYEGGHRVPFVVRWPGKVRCGSVCTQTITLADILATCADIIGHRIAADTAEDSVSLLPLLEGARIDGRLHDIVIHHSVSGHFAVRKGRWKLLLCRGSGGWSPPSERQAAEKGMPLLQLYDLKDDPRETRNLQGEQPAKVKELIDDLARAIRRGRTTPGPRQANDGWPNTFSKPILAQFPQLAPPKKDPASQAD